MDNTYCDMAFTFQLGSKRKEPPTFHQLSTRALGGTGDAWSVVRRWTLYRTAKRSNVRLIIVVIMSSRLKNRII